MIFNTIKDKKKTPGKPSPCRSFSYLSQCSSLPYLHLKNKRKMNTINLVLLLSLVSFFTISTMVNAATTVKDIGGKKLRTHTDYYVLPLIRGRGGGLALAARNKTSCPFYVAQEQQELSNGLPLKFFSVNPKDKFVNLSTDMNFVFSAATICVQSTGWKLGDVDAVTGRRYVATGGKIGSPGLGTVSNWFNIQEYKKNTYKLVFCPMVCKFCKVVCGDVGVFVEGGRRWLGLTDVPFPVIFKKA